MVDGKPMARVQRTTPVVAQTSPYPLTYRLDFLATAGTLVMFATLFAYLSMLAAGANVNILGIAISKTFKQLRLPVVTIDGKQVGDGTPGPVATRLRRLYIERARATAI